MSDPILSDIDFKNKMTWDTLKAPNWVKMNINPFFRNVVTAHDDRRHRCDHKIVYLEII